MNVKFFKAGGLLVAGVDPSGGEAALPGFGDQRELELLVPASGPLYPKDVPPH